MAWLRRETVAVAAFAIAALAAAVAPLARGIGASGQQRNDEIPEWPVQYEGRALVEMPLSEREKAFLTGFPGRVGRFSDGQRELIIRRVDAPTRRLHPASDCLRGAGYGIKPAPATVDDAGKVRRCMHAVKGKSFVFVCEFIVDGSGRSWPDVTEWYWHAALGATKGPWWAYTTVDSR